MTYHGHPIMTNLYKSAKNEDIDMKLSGCDHISIITNPYKSNKIEDIDLKLPGYDHMGHLRSLMN